MVGSFFAGQSSAVAAQYLLSGQQNQLASGQHPAGHSVSSGPQVVFTTFFGSKVGIFLAGQSSAVAAQYLLSGQQNQLASGQHPAGHSVSSGPQVVFTTDNFFGSKFGNLMAGQSSAVAAQYLLSGHPC